MTAPSTIHLSALPLPPRTLALLTAHGIETAEDLAAIIDAGELETVRGIGPATARAIEDAAFAHGVEGGTKTVLSWLPERDQEAFMAMARILQMLRSIGADSHITTRPAEWAIRLAQFRAIAAHHPSVPLSAVLAAMYGEGER